jgi:NADH pyrophosphatase NudC (nudix superfamily)
MSTRFYCNSESCIHGDKGPFVLELAQEAVMDGNNMATIFCPRCGKPMKPLPPELQGAPRTHRFYCTSETCGGNGDNPFFIDLPEEAIMDDHNMATVFCPKCGKEMSPVDQTANGVVNY